MASTATLIQPSGELWKKIREELNEDVNTRAQDLAAIKEWLRKQPHLPDEWEDACLMTFLRGCSFSLEKCKKKLDMYFTMRAACPEFFANRDVTRPELMDLLNRAQGPTLPGLTPQGRRVTIARALDKNLDTNQLNDVFKLAMMIGDVRLREEVEGIAGDVYVLDASILMPSHLAKISPAVLKKFFICIQEAYPVKLKEIHVINASPLVDVVFNIVKPFLKEKMKKRVFFHADVQCLQDYIPKEILPVEFGGNGCSLEDVNKAWMKKLEEYSPWFKQQEALKANEAMRPGKPTNYDELFGIDGSFRQLSID
ncbi:alpha-tocopherol transfer protein-like [Bombyx mandarina]|uniref:CRAL-TRIO domain-containing protein n=2 Tax=Bombyx TaxID=7090 RepID=A0A8R2AMQ6_BOMMO|nr:alpha-tocopherol transfer protein [Bombyx mori]XP_028043335.1 alpha-tocopherol transfer protein-like [Bombyx mandarina]